VIGANTGVPIASLFCSQQAGRLPDRAEARRDGEEHYMAQRKMADPFGADHRVAAPETPVLFAGVGLTAGLFAIALVWFMPATLVLPSLSLLALVLAGGLALLA
jgi:hypothetical protein